jgi:hypothetical protein
LVRLKGLEPLAHSLEGCCSIHLSYRRILNSECGMQNSELGYCPIFILLFFSFRIPHSQFHIFSGRGERI